VHRGDDAGGGLVRGGGAMKITRKRALELAIELIVSEMTRTQRKIDTMSGGSSKRNYDKMAELAAALAWLENAARQKELL